MIIAAIVGVIFKFRQKSKKTIIVNQSKELQEPETKFDLDFPTVIDGTRGLAFIESIIESAKSDKKCRNLGNSYI